MSEHRKCSRIVKRGKKSSACKRKIKGVWGTSKLAMCAQHLKEAEKEQSSGWCRMDPNEARRIASIDDELCYYCGKRSMGSRCDECHQSMCGDCKWPYNKCGDCQRDQEEFEQRLCEDYSEESE